MPTIGFKRISGKNDYRTLLVDSTSVIARGDLVSTDESAGDLIVGATNIANVGVAAEASASGTTTAIKYDRISSGDIFRALVETGTPALSEKGKFADINSQNGLTLTESNNDCRIVDWSGDTANIDVVFTTVENLGPDTA